MNKKSLLVLAIFGIIFVSGCAQGGNSTLSSGVTAKLEISKAPTLNENAELTFTITTIRDASNVSAKFILPEGFEFVSGNLNWNGELKENQPMQLKATIKAVKTGEWTIIGAVSGANDYLYITVNENSASISEKPYPIPERGKQYAESN